MRLLDPPLRAFAQFDDRAFLSAVLHSVGWTALAFVAVGAWSGYAAHAALAEHGWLAWFGPVLGVAVAALLAFILFLPVATAIAALFTDPIAAAVEARFYPGLPPANPAPLTQQAWDGIALGVRVLAWQCLALILAVMLPGVGLILGWAVSAWGLGRGLFVAVAMRRMDRAAAGALYRANRWSVLAQGALITAASLVPVLNLLAPILGTAAMVHVLHTKVLHREIQTTRR